MRPKSSRCQCSILVMFFSTSISLCICLPYNAMLSKTIKHCSLSLSLSLSSLFLRGYMHAMVVAQSSLFFLAIDEKIKKTDV